MTTENNKIIAEFIGLVYRTKKDYQGWYKDSSFTDRICSFDGLKYHSDWNWLMEVVQKIESLGDDLNIYAYHCELIYNVGENIETFEAKSKIEAVYNACVEFIKWYNLQIK